MLRRPWTVAQFAIALVLGAISAVGIIGTVVFEAAEFTFTFQGGVQAFAIFPGLVISLIVNGVVMGVPRSPEPGPVLRGFLIAEFALIALLLVFHFVDDGSGATFGFAILTWPIVIAFAVTVAVMAAIAVVRAPAAPPTPPVAPPAH